MYKIKKIINSVHSVIKWFPIIWKDRQWDYGYLFEIMLKKLELMEDFYENGHTVGADSKVYASDIREAIKELRYIADGKNNEEAFAPMHEEHLDKYGEYTLENMLEDVNREKTEEERQSFRDMVSECDRLYDEHMGNFCRIFKDKVQWWWD
jgi:hypothetical protein